MKKWMVPLGLLVLIVFLGGGWFLWKSNLISTQQSPSESEEEVVRGSGSSDDEPEVRQGESEEGTSSTAADDMKIELSEGQLKNIDLDVKPLSTGKISSLKNRPATVRFNKDRTARVGPRVEAKVDRVIRDLGDSVDPGDTLALLSSVKLGEVRSRYAAAKARLNTARASYNRERKLYQKKISSQAVLEEARARFKEARSKLTSVRETLRLFGVNEEWPVESSQGDTLPPSYFYLTSPMTGVVQQRNLSPGQTVDPDETPFLIVDTSRMWVFIDGYEQDISSLKPGLSVKLTVRSFPDRAFQGRVDWISSELDQKTRTVDVRASVKNPDGLLRDGMFGTARINLRGTVSHAMMPVDAVQTVEGKDVVFIPSSDSNTFRAVPVQVGEENNGRVQILSGLSPGTPVVMSGAYELKAALTSKGRGDMDYD